MDGRSWAARTSLLETNDAAGVDALERCLALDAQDYPAARDLIVLCVRQDRLEYAAEVNARFLSTCGDAALVRSAHEALVRGELERAERLLAENRLDDALKTAEQADRGARAWQAGGAFVVKAAALRDRILAARQHVAAGRKPEKTNWR